MRDNAAASAEPGHQQQHSNVRNRDDPKGKGKGGKDKRQRTNDGNGNKTATMDAYKVKFCGAYNAKKGCVYHERDCPQRAKHLCNVVMPNGDLCRSTRHNALGHY